MASTIGIKLGVDGEREFKSALTDINAQLRLLGSEMKLVDSQFSKSDKSIQALTARNNALQNSIEGQKSKIDLLEKALANATASFGENDRRTLAWKQRLNEARAELNKLESQLAENNQALENSSEAFTDAGESAESYSGSITKTKESTNGFSSAMSALGSALKVAGVAITASLAAISAAAVKAGKALINMSKEGAEYADNVLTQSAVTGIATDKLQEYMYAAELVDVSTETLTGSMAKNIRSMKSAADGSSSFAEAYEKLGISVINADGSLRNSDDVYWELIDALGQVENETERDALAMTLLGRSAQDLNPLIKAGSVAMSELGEEAREAGYVLSDELLESYGAYDDALQRMKNSTTSFKNALGTVLLPILTEVSTEGSKLLGEFSNAIIDCNGDISKMGDVISSAIPQAIQIVEKYIPTILSLINTIITSVAKAILTNLSSIMNAISSLFQNVLKELVEALPSVVSLLADFAKVIVSTIISNVPALLEALKEVIRNIASALNSGTGSFLYVINDLLTQIYTAVAEMFPVLLEGIINAIGNIASSLGNILPSLLDTIISYLEQMLTSIADLLPSLIDAVLSILKAVVNAILSAIPTLASSLGRIITSVVSTILNAIPTIINAVLEIVTGIINALPEIITSIIGMLGEILDGLLNALFEALPQILEAVFSLVGGIIDALPDIISLLVETIPTLIRSLIQMILSHIPDLINCVLELIDGVLSHIPEFIMAIIQAIPEIIQSIVQGFISAIPQFWNIGIEIVKGLWEGIKSMIKWLWDKICGWCSDIWNGIKNFFGIHSPSRKFAEIGTNLGLGLSEGFVDTLADCESDMQKAVPTDFDIEGQAHIKDVAFDTNSEVTQMRKITNEISLARTEDNSNEYLHEEISLLRENNSLLRELIAKSLNIVIGDDVIGRANTRYEDTRGADVNDGGFKNAY